MACLTPNYIFNRGLVFQDCSSTNRCKYINILTKKRAEGLYSYGLISYEIDILYTEHFLNRIVPFTFFFQGAFSRFAQCGTARSGQ